MILARTSFITGPSKGSTPEPDPYRSGHSRSTARYDPAKRTFQAFTGFHGKAPDGYTLRSAYDARRNRILLVLWDEGPNVWAVDLKQQRWNNLGVQNQPLGGTTSPGKGRRFLVDLSRNTYTEVRTEPAPPYAGTSFRVLYDPMHQVTLAVEGNAVWSFKAPFLAAGRPF